MLAKNARGWSFDASLSDASEVQCQDDDCAVWSPLAAWAVADLECETCGEHDAMECPACGWLHDHVHSGLTPFRVRGQAGPELSTRDPSRLEPKGTPPIPICLYCTAAPADLGRYCSGCYGRVFHEDGSPLVLGEPGDPWREFNAEADRTIADAKLHAVLAPRMAARLSFPATVAAWKLGPNKQQNKPD